MSYLYANDMPEKWSLSGLFGITQTRTAVHEFGHLLGLTHDSYTTPLNLMASGGPGFNVTEKQLGLIMQNKSNLNKGFNYTKQIFTNKKLPNTTLVDNGRMVNIHDLGFRLRLDKLK